MELRLPYEVVHDTLGHVAVPRSPHWGKVRDAYLLEHPLCVACGGKDHLNAHHRKPFHLFPELELDPTNLLTLCEHGPGDTNCHLLLGHGGNWSLWNPQVQNDVEWFAEMLARIRSGSCPKKK